jgi:pimeloyl-ACP methyl ester carboxylesterase
VVLLHGFPASSFMFRELLADLSDEYRLVPPTTSASASPTRRRSTTSRR